MTNQLKTIPRTKTMKSSLFSLTAGFTLLTLGLLAIPATAKDGLVLKTQESKDSYAIGADLARNLKRRGVQMEPEALLQGFRDVLAGQKLLLSDDELRATLSELQADERQKAILLRKGQAVVADETGARGAAFLAQNKTNSGVVCLPSGLQYKILKSGEGRKPAGSDTVTCRFLGMLIDGRAFAGSDPSGPPATLNLGQVIPGLKEGLQLMPVGSRWQFVIPPQLAYGEQGTGRTRLGPRIDPNATLIYEVELVAIEEPKPKEPSSGELNKDRGNTI